MATTHEVLVAAHLVKQSKENLDHEMNVVFVRLHGNVGKNKDGVTEEDRIKIHERLDDFLDKLHRMATM